MLYSGERIDFAEQNDDGSFSTQPLPGSNEGFGGLLGIQRGSGDAVAAWSVDDVSGNRSAVYAVRVGETWQVPELAVADFNPVDLAYARSGAVHVIGTRLTGTKFGALVYAVSPAPGGTFAAETLVELPGENSAMALDDNTNQPIVIYAVDSGDQNGIWFLLGPAV